MSLGGGVGGGLQSSAFLCLQVDGPKPGMGGGGRTNGSLRFCAAAISE